MATTHMSNRVQERGAGQTARPPSLVDLILVRVAARGGATRVETIRDLGQLVAHRLSPGEWRQFAENSLAGLLDYGLAEERRGRYAATTRGEEHAGAFLALRQSAPLGPWAEVRDAQLIARALGLEGETTQKLRALSTPEGLRALIVQKAFGLPRRVKTTPARLRAELAVVALERAFGNKIKTGLGSGNGLSAKAGRLLAGQLSRRPRDFGTDSRLVAGLAAEAADAVQPTLDVLRASILKRFVSELVDSANQTVAAEAGRSGPPRSHPVKAMTPVRGHRDEETSSQTELAAASEPVAANDTAPGPATIPFSRPDLDEFAAEVARCADRVAEGWPGSRKAFISQVWPAIRDGRSEWGLSEIEFKCMLVEAHRAGRLALASVDLKNKNNLKDVQDSAISYMNTVWHFVRVED